ncbi:MAG TPA: hypothetical protein VHT25_00605 [Solirubrobacteraceae bacterium]|jgi:hypothetical protein|nr:hypothetical protein [Solirubrobacteraceae bacterium]
MSLVPVPAEQGGAKCTNCGAALVADQRYCLSCGQPASPVRLAFLDALQGEGAAAAGAPAIQVGPAVYVPLSEGRGANGWLRRNSGLLGLLAVLVLCLIAGLLIGHWASQGGTKVPAKQVVEVKGLSGLAAAPAAAATTTPTAKAPAEQKESAAAKAAAAKAEAKQTKAEKAPPAKPVKVAPAKIKKLTQSSGKQHQEEINSLGAQPIETG